MDEIARRRAGAFMIDLILLAAAVSITEGTIDTSDLSKDVELFGMSFTVRIGITFVLYLLYYSLFDLVNNGSSLGKMLMKIGMRNANDDVPRFSILLKRTFLKVISTVLLPVAVLLFLINDSFTIQDHFSKTKTIKIA